MVTTLTVASARVGLLSANRSVFEDLVSSATETGGEQHLRLAVGGLDTVGGHQAVVAWLHAADVLSAAPL